MKKNFFGILYTLLFLIVFSSCGKYGAPIPPERLAPKAVYDVEALGYQRGVVFKWTGSTDDVRSKDLKTMDGYYIEKACAEDKDELGFEIGEDKIKELDFEQIAIVNDRQVQIKEELKKEALAKGLSARRVSVPKENLKFNYIDENIKRGDICYYKIIPFNQGDVKGQEGQIIKVKFNGEDSIFSYIGKRRENRRRVFYEN